MKILSKYNIIEEYLDLPYNRLENKVESKIDKGVMSVETSLNNLLIKNEFIKFFPNEVTKHLLLVKKYNSSKKGIYLKELLNCNIIDSTWANLSMLSKLPVNTIEQFHNNLNWDVITLENININHELIIKYKDKINWFLLFLYRTNIITEELLNKCDVIEYIDLFKLVNIKV